MGKPDNRIKSLGMLKKIDGEYYLNASKAKEENRLVAWVNASVPVEILVTMDIVPIYPENHAAMIQAGKGCPEMADIALAEGYSPDLCSYALCDIGSIVSHKSPLPTNLPQPDFMFLMSSQCGTLTNWFEATSRRLNVPYFTIDVPYWGGDTYDENAVKYIQDQFMDFIVFLEEKTGRRFDWDRFAEVCAISRETSNHWAEVIKLGMSTPSPLTVFDHFIAMSPIVTQRGTDVALRFYEALHQEMVERVNTGVAAVPGEKFRLYWDNLPLWHGMRNLSTFLVSRQACVCANMYTWGWTEFAPKEGDPLMGWIRSHLHSTQTADRRRRIDIMIDMIDKYNLNGFLIHLNRSCKILSLDALKVKEEVERISGIPGFVMEADHGDQRHFAEEQVFGRMDSYFEMLSSR